MVGGGAEAQGLNTGPEAKAVRFEASNFIPLDSWMYPAFDRLEALGYVPSGQMGMRPWTRLQCARMLREAVENDALRRNTDDDGAELEIARLSTEFLQESRVLGGDINREAGPTEVYVRSTEIVGAPLRDSFHFGQTIYNDFGRRYGQGFNAIAGVHTQAEYGPLSLSFKGEFQDARALFPYNSTALAAIASMDAVPVMPLPNVGAQQRVRPVEATISLKLAGWQGTFGEQPQWWGVSRAGSLLLSNNAEAPVLLLIQHDRQAQFPWIFAYLGKISNTFFMGQLRGQHFVRGAVPGLILEGSASHTLNPQPFIWGDQLNLKMTPNLELGFELVTMWAGYGRPATLGTWLHTFSFRGNDQAVDPGKRYGGFHFAYRLPLMRNATLYTDALTNDEPSPLAYPKQSAISPGLYIASIPGARHMDLRLEGVYTNIPNYADGIGAVYFNQHYADGYRNAGQLMGSWVGRAGIGYDAKATYWLSRVNRVDVSFRRQTADRHMIGGGGLMDVQSSAYWQLGGGLAAEGTLTYERWRFPLVTTTARHPVVATIGLRYVLPGRAAKP